MLSKPYRLQKDQEIKAVWQKGRNFYGRYLGLKFLPNKLTNNRFCFVISNKVSKKATARNRLKRQLRETVQLNLAKIKGNNDIVISARPAKEVLDQKYKDLESELFWLFKKVKLM
ncbi:MAG: ribonuclease P protein component [Patescibacteria group bacterium]|jgi:ribonuclease P protein component